MTQSPERVIFFSSFHYPTQYAHPLHALFMAHAFAKEWGDRFLFITGGDPMLTAIPYKTPFVARLPLLSALHLRTIAYTLWLALFLAIHPKWRTGLVVVTNDILLAAGAGFIKSWFGFRLVVDVHGSARRSATRLAFTNADRLVFVTPGLKTALAHTPDTIEKAIVIGNAVDVDAFTQAGNGDRIRQELDIPTSAFVIGYLGRFRPMHSDKGVDFLIEALPADTVLILVGGTSDEVAHARAHAEARQVSGQVRLVPYVPFSLMPSYAAACDALAYVPPAGDKFLATETSPMKLYEYMAARRPIIASDFPTFRTALGDENAWFIAPGSIPEFTQAVEQIRHGQEVVRAVVARAYEKVATNTWNVRARRMLESL